MTSKPDRREVVAGIGAITAGFGISLPRGEAQTMNEAPDIVFFNGRITTLDRADWSPVGAFGGYQRRVQRDPASKHAFAAGCGCVCNVHGHAHVNSWAADVPVSDRNSFWGAIGCSCWAF